MIDEDFRTYLGTKTALPIQKGTIDENTDPPWVYYQRAGGETDTDLAGRALLAEVLFDVEVVGPDDGPVQDTADALKTALNGYRGAMGGTAVKGAFVSDHSDDYQPKSLGADDGYALATFQVQVIY